MKVAIMTLQLGGSYGGILQAYALQRVIKDLGCQVITVNRKRKKENLPKKMTKVLYRSVRKALGIRKESVFIERLTEASYVNTNRFISKNINLSDPIRSTKALASYFDLEGFNAVVVGSDQTWRPRYSINILNYYLDFLPNKSLIKIAYATSFGVAEWEYSEKDEKNCRILARSFNAVSVREKSAIKLCEENLQVKACHVLDPTLLLNKEVYIKLANANQETKQGVFEFWLDGNPEKRKVAKEISRELNTTTFTCQPISDLDKTRSGYSANDYTLPPVEDWINSFHNADFVVTDSYHGMVFSIIFRKPFVVISNPNRGKARFESLASLLGLQERIFSSPNDFKYSKNLMDMKSDIIDEKINIHRAKSLNFLASHLMSQKQ